MKTQPTTLVRMLMVLAFTIILGITVFGQSKNPQKVQDHTSIAEISGTAEGKTISYTNPYNNQSASNFAGAFNGTLNSHAEKFYCIDLQHCLV